MLLGWIQQNRRIIFASLGMLMLFLSSTNNLFGSDKAAQEADSLLAEAHRMAPLISTSELTKLMESDKQFLLIDVRTEAEFNAGHLQNALLMPRDVLVLAIQEERLDTDQNCLVLYCRSGNRSALAIMDLLDLGLTNVKHLDGGFQAWFNEGLSFYSDHGQIKGISFEEEE